MTSHPVAPDLPSLLAADDWTSGTNNTSAVIINRQHCFLALCASCHFIAFAQPAYWAEGVEKERTRLHFLHPLSPSPPTGAPVFTEGASDPDDPTRTNHPMPRTAIDWVPLLFLSFRAPAPRVPPTRGGELELGGRTREDIDGHGAVGARLRQARDEFLEVGRVEIEGNLRGNVALAKRGEGGEMSALGHAF